MKHRGLKEELGIQYDPESEAHEGLLLLGSPAAHAWEWIKEYALSINADPKEMVSVAIHNLRSNEAWDHKVLILKDARQIISSKFWDKLSELIQENISQDKRKNFILRLYEN